MNRYDGFQTDLVGSLIANDQANDNSPTTALKKLMGN